MSDIISRFMFDSHSVRGELVQLNSTFKNAMNGHDYPEIIQCLLGEMLAACSMLTATLKFEGEISLQIQSEGYVKYAVVHATHKQQLKAVARYDDGSDIADTTFRNLFKKGYLVITITPSEGERYQGITSLDQDSLAMCLENYFYQSEQLPTKLLLFTSSEFEQRLNCAGLMLQVLPKSSESSMATEQMTMEHLEVLANTVTKEEIFSLDCQTILYRLFNQENVRLLSTQPVAYVCDCSKARTAQALQSIDEEQLIDILKEDGRIVMSCHYCNSEYIFDEVDIKHIKAGNFAFLQGNASQRH